MIKTADILVFIANFKIKITLLMTYNNKYDTIEIQYF